MKFQSKKSLIFLAALTLLNSLEARDIILVENQADPTQGQMVLRLLQEKFNMPRKLITYRSLEKKPCSRSSEAIMQLCLRANGELVIVKVDRFVMENSLGVFQEMGE